MTAKINQKQPVEDGKNNDKKRSFVLPLLLGGLAAALIILVIYYFGVFDSGKKTAQSVASAYQLYTAGDTKTQAKLFFGDTQSDGFKTAVVDIFESELQINRIKQLLILLAAGPQDNQFINLLPEGTALIDAYLDANSILYLDLSQEFAANCKGGTTGEYQAIYSIVNTVFYNFSFVKGIKVAVNGSEKETLAGHISLKSIFSNDEDLSKYNK